MSISGSDDVDDEETIRRRLLEFETWSIRCYVCKEWFRRGPAYHEHLQRRRHVILFRRAKRDAERQQQEEERHGHDGLG